MKLLRHRSALLQAFAASLLFGSLACQLLAAAAPAGPERWAQAIAAFEAADQTASPPQDAILFIGSSTIVRWKTLAQDFPEHTVINRGFGGSQIADSTFYADRIVIPYRPRLIVLRAGGNDIHAGKTPEQVAADFDAFVQKVRAKLPDVRIAYMTINASPARWANAEREQKANELIQAYIAKGKNLVYIDNWDATLDADGKPREELFVQDRLHFNEEGYKIFADSVRKHLSPQANAKLGMNLNGPADWNTELPFVDVFRLSRTWISQRKGQPWGKGPELQVDEHGWVKRLEADCWAESPLCTIDSGRYPGGRYTVLYDGRGRIDFWGAAKVVSEEPGRMAIDVDPSRGGMFLRLHETDPNDFVRNIRVLMPGFETIYRDQPFHPVFLKRWAGVACFRFMDWMHTNGSEIETWADRPTPESATFTEKGVALEWMIDLCNRQQADAWFCMPHRADDDYARRFAEMVKDRLDPKLKVYIEYSNEVWNSQFPQTRYSWAKAKELGIGPQERPWEGGGMYYARRSVQIFQIWEQVFGGTERLVRVIAWQSGNTHWMDNIVLPFEDAYRHTDSISIAPYISMNVPREGKELTADEVVGWSLERVLDYMEQESLPKSIRAIEATKAIADKYGLTLTAYEGGQHMVGVGGGENNETMNALFFKANAHPRMGQIYDRYYEAWTRAGGDLFCYFSSVGRWSKWGSWGILQHYDDDPADAPKFLATMRWARQRGQNVNLTED